MIRGGLVCAALVISAIAVFFACSRSSLAGSISDTNSVENLDLPSSIAPQVHVVYRAPSDSTAGNYKGQNLIAVDVFWCPEDNIDGHKDTELVATQYASSLATIIKVEKGTAFANIGEIRTRPISKSEFLSKIVTSTDQPESPSYKPGPSAPILTFDKKDEVLKLIGDKWNYFGVGPLTVGNNIDNLYTPNYMSAFVCDTNFRGAVNSGTVYFQVKDLRQKNYTSAIVGPLQDSLPDVRVNKRIDVVGDKSPQRSQLRYFYPDDIDAARKVASEISNAARRANGVSSVPEFDLQIQQVPGYEGKVRPGTFEAWISK